MGFSYKTDDLDNIIEKVAYVMDTFDFVMISDYIEGSLVLIASELNWNLEDVIFSQSIEIVNLVIKLTSS